MKNFIETSIPITIMQKMDTLGFYWKHELSIACLQGLFEAMAKFLSFKKSKDKPVGVVLNDLTNGFHFAAYVTFVPQNENGADEGSWVINYTFDENDIDPKSMVLYYYSDPEMRSTFEDTTYSKDGIIWKHQLEAGTDKPCEASSMNILCVLLDSVRDYMISNINFDNEMCLTNYMNFVAEAESGGTVYILCEPSNLIKEFIKTDNAIGVINPSEFELPQPVDDDDE